MFWEFHSNLSSRYTFTNVPKIEVWMCTNRSCIDFETRRIQSVPSDTLIVTNVCFIAFSPSLSSTPDLPSALSLFISTLLTLGILLGLLFVWINLFRKTFWNHKNNKSKKNILRTFSVPSHRNNEEPLVSYSTLHNKLCDVHKYIVIYYVEYLLIPIKATLLD